MNTQLINKYISLTPSFNYVSKKYLQNRIQIDHIAHRTLDTAANSRITDYYLNRGLLLGKEKYDFPRLNVKAKWLKPNNLRSINYRIFLSQYMGSENWKIDTYLDYRDIMAKNQYVAWTLLHGNDINHVAITVKNIENFMELIGNDKNLKIATDLQISKDGNLKQFSLQADPIMYKFGDGVQTEVPYAFVEFIERLNGREGFESDNADKIFDSTKGKLA